MNKKLKKFNKHINHHIKIYNDTFNDSTYIHEAGHFLMFLKTWMNMRYDISTKHNLQQKDYNKKLLFYASYFSNEIENFLGSMYVYTTHFGNKVIRGIFKYSCGRSKEFSDITQECIPIILGGIIAELIFYTDINDKDAINTYFEKNKIYWKNDINNFSKKSKSDIINTVIFNCKTITEYDKRFIKKVSNILRNKKVSNNIKILNNLELTKLGKIYIRDKMSYYK